MEDTIRQALWELKKQFGDSVFLEPTKFKSGLADILPGSQNEPLRNLMNIAIGGVDAYSRLKNASSGNITSEVVNLTKEMSKRYFIQEDITGLAIEYIAELLGYQLQTTTNPLKDNSLPSNVKIGGKIQFGDYIWRVLDVETGKALIITENIIFKRRFDEKTIAWEKSELHNYLNGIFKKRLTLVEQGKSQPNVGLNDDKIFLLSTDEANLLFQDESDRVATYNGVAWWWWLRSPPGTYSYAAAAVSGGGTVNNSGFGVNTASGGVRPALWLNL